MVELEMPTIDKTEEWEESLDQDNAGSVKFPISMLDRDVIANIGEVEGTISVSSPKMVNSPIREIKLGKTRISKNKGNKLF